MKKKSGVDRPAISLVSDNDLSLRYWDVFLKPREYVTQFTLLVSSRPRSQQGLVNLLTLKEQTAKDAKIYVGRSTAVYDILCCAHALHVSIG